MRGRPRRSRNCSRCRRRTSTAPAPITIQGTGFGSTQGAGKVTLDGVELPTTGWSNTQISVTVPAGTTSGAQQLEITAANGMTTANGLTFHVLGGDYTPTVREVGPGKTYATIQAALDAAFDNNADDLVVVYPDTATNGQPAGCLLREPDHGLAGQAPGRRPRRLPGAGLRPGHGARRQRLRWRHPAGHRLVHQDRHPDLGRQPERQRRSGNLRPGLGERDQPDGRARQFTSGFRASIDGFDLRGGDQRGFPGNINEVTGLPTGLPPNIQTQGGAIFANAFARYLQITNNVVQDNGGGYGTIRIGTPDLTGADTNQHNENVRIAQNRIINNAGTNLAGAIGLFAGSDGYEIADNDICGNFTLEYGGGRERLRTQPQRQDPSQPDHLQPGQRRGRRHHDRRRAAGQPGRPVARVADRWTSTPTRSRRTSPTTTAAASGS